jgi:phosphate transport system protein
MPRDSFARELQRLQDEVLALGSMVENVLTDAVDVLKRRDAEGARRIIAGDREINRRRFALERDALVLIATQQPLARDLRMIAAVLEVATELERIGDYGKGISRISLMIGDAPFVKPLVDIPVMAQKARSMLHQALEAFVNQDVEQARAIPKQDSEVDALYNQVYRELIAIIRVTPTAIDQANHLLWAAHNLERAADRVTNICERVVFTVTGQMQEMDSEDAESPESVS